MSTAFELMDIRGCIWVDKEGVSNEMSMQEAVMLVPGREPC